MRSNAWLFSAWRRSVLGGMLFVAVIFGMPQKAHAVGASELITLTNIERTKNGLPALAYNGRLASSAYAKAQDMLTKGYWAHTAPDGTQPWTFVSRSGYGYTVVGENLAKGFGSNSAVISGWMSSPGHKANILKSDYRDVGIAAVSGVLLGERVTLVVAHYGSTGSEPEVRPVPVAAALPVSPKTIAKPKPAQKSPLRLFLNSLVNMASPPVISLIKL